MADPEDWPAEGSPAGSGQAGAGPAGAGRPAGAPASGAAAGYSTAFRPAPAGNQFARPALIAGIAGILVVPGIVLGVLGLRRAQATGSGRGQSALGIALSLLWAVGIIVVVSLPGHQSSAADPGCAAYQAAGRAAAGQAAAALSA